MCCVFVCVLWCGAVMWCGVLKHSAVALLMGWNGCLVRCDVAYDVSRGLLRYEEMSRGVLSVHTSLITQGVQLHLQRANECKAGPSSLGAGAWIRIRLVST